MWSIFIKMKLKVSQLATGLGYATSTRPRLLFPKILYQAINRITTEPSFSETGIFSFKKTVIKPLAGPVAGSRKLH
jgi:hypothetical protein